MSLKVLTWNVEWATPRSWKRAPVILDRINRHKPELVCLTEAHAELLQGHVVTSQEDYGIRPIHDGWRKVVLWSKQPWDAVDEIGDASMPLGRFVVGVTQTSLGDVTVIGVCIPYSHALVNGYGYRKVWQAHEEYLTGLAKILQRAPTERVIVMGDFNQKIGKGRNAPLRLQSALRDTVPRGMTIATGAVGFEGRRTIDHIALERLTSWSSRLRRSVSNFHDDRRRSCRTTSASRPRSPPGRPEPGFAGPGCRGAATAASPGSTCVMRLPRGYCVSNADVMGATMPDAATPETGYTMGYNEEFRQLLDRRSAATHAAHLLPHLQPGMRVLDLGCGPGTISVGLAEAVAPGELLGIDLEESQVAMARGAAEAGGHGNATFHVGDATDLPFEDDEFDAVHCHAVLMHIPDTGAALAEVRRVLKPGASSLPAR